MEDIQQYNFTVKSNIHDYEVNFIDNVKKILSSELKEGDFIIIDNKVKSLYPKWFKNALENYNYIGIDAAESQKSYQEVEPVINTLIEKGFRKNHRLIAIGGGITQDVTAFIASILYRGVQWYFFPTTLLAQGDSCIGSKTSINFGKFKNQVGGFYPPNKIYVDPKFLNTLPFKELQSGLGEMAHYFVVAGEEDFDRYKRDYAQALVDKNVLRGVIARSLEIKKSYIEIDEYDKNERQVFNYGHSFGHAIESLTSYGVPHGIAISVGMDMSNFVSMKKGYITSEVRQNSRELFEKIWFGYTNQVKGLDIDNYLVALSKDKKNKGPLLGLILNKGYGKVFKDFTENDMIFRSWIVEYFANELNY
ncbi:MAG: 3-dehydroquinate synthase [Flavobacteriales bacterium]|jgi:3-dehydroquinate synthase